MLVYKPPIFNSFIITSLHIHRWVRFMFVSSSVWISTPMDSINSILNTSTNCFSTGLIEACFFYTLIVYYCSIVLTEFHSQITPFATLLFSISFLSTLFLFTPCFSPLPSLINFFIFSRYFDRLLYNIIYSSLLPSL